VSEGLEHGNRCDLPGSGKSCNKGNSTGADASGYSATCSISGSLPGLCMAGPRGPVQATFRDERSDAHAQVTAITRGLGAGTCWRSGRSPPGVTGRDSRVAAACSSRSMGGSPPRVTRTRRHHLRGSGSRQPPWSPSKEDRRGILRRRAGPDPGVGAPPRWLTGPATQPPGLSGQAPKTPQPSPPTSIADQPKASASEKGSKPARRIRAAAGGHFRS